MQNKYIIHICVSSPKKLPYKSLCGKVSRYDYIISTGQLRIAPKEPLEYLCPECVAHEDYPLLVLAALE